MPKQYRRQAEECLDPVKQAGHANSRAALRQLADDFRRAAERLECRIAILRGRQTGLKALGDPASVQEEKGQAQTETTASP
jgi:hypothetical protein